MPSRYHPIEEGLWDDDKFDARGEFNEAAFEERAFFAFLTSNTRQRPSGIYRATDEQIASGSRLPLKRVKAYLMSLHNRSLIVRDGEWIFLPGYLKRQSKNERLLIGAESDVKRCTSVIILMKFAEKYPLYSRWSTDGLQTVGRRVEQNVPSEQSTSEQSTSEQSTNSSPRAEESWPTPHLLIAKYNSEAPDECPAVKTISPGRIKKAKQYLSAFPQEEFWTAVFKQMHLSRFLRGLKQNANGHESFIADFDWLLTKGKDGSENAVKVRDGRYRDG